MQAKLWKNLIFLCIAAAWLFVLVRFAYRKPEVRLKSGITYPLPPSPAPSLGQSGMWPCWLSTPTLSAGQPVVRGKVADCLLLVPGQGRLDVLEVNLATGAFVHVATDLFLPARPVIALTRVSRPLVDWERKFHVFLPHVYDDFTVGDRFPYTFQKLITPDNAGFTYERISQGTGYADALYLHTQTRTILYGSEIRWNGNGWSLRLSDGSELVFPDAYLATRPQHGAPVSFRDPGGDVLRLVRDNQGNLLKVVSQDGQWLELSYDGDRISAIKDSRGDLVQYSYDDLNRLRSVVTPNGTTPSYTYHDSNHVIAIHKDDHLLLRNAYDSAGRVVKQTFADGQTYRFTYVLDANGYPQQTDVVGPRGYAIEVRFHEHSYEMIDLSTASRPKPTLR